MISVGLFGLAQLDPVVTSHPPTYYAVLSAVVIGSQIPDIDIVYRLRGNIAYFRNHRGWSHSLPMTILWPLLIGSLLTLLSPFAVAWRVFLAAALAVLIHILLDICNTYGTQCLRPFSQRWFSLNFIPLFDPILFGGHALIWGMWFLFPKSIGWWSATLYTLLALYLLGRRWLQQKLYRHLYHLYPHARRITVMATPRPYRWRFVLETPTYVHCGTLRYQPPHINKPRWEDSLPIINPEDHPEIRYSQTFPAVKTLLYFTNYAYPVVRSIPGGREVRWYDIRYLRLHRPSLVAIVLIHDQNADSKQPKSFMGWLHKQPFPIRKPNPLPPPHTPPQPSPPRR